MPEIKLKIDDLVLDHDNPRITHAEGQQEALQKIVKDQKAKLVKLAESIVKQGMNPMDRLLVLRLNQKPEKFISLEGNRRVAVLNMLNNPAVMSGLEMPPAVKRGLERHAKNFKKGRVEPLACFELSREESKYWLNLRHNIGHDGAGIEGWNTLAKRRFEGKPPVVQALDLVTERAGLTPSELAYITDKFPTTTFERFLEDRKVRKALGLDKKAGKLVTKLPADEVARPLKKIVLDLATKRKQVGDFMKTGQMLKYLEDELGAAHLPKMSKALSVERTLDEIPTSEFTKVRGSTPRRKPDPSDRREVVPKTCKLNVTKNRLAQIYKELRALKLIDAPNAIAVLLRAFLEMSVDHFLEGHGGKLKFSRPGGGEQWKPLDKKLAEAVDILVNMGVPKNHFAAITRSIAQKSSPMHTDLLHQYVHDQYTTPLPEELKAAWDHAQPLFEKIWP